MLQFLYLNNIIMKSSLFNSYYMGISYRSTHRPDHQFGNNSCLDSFHISLNPIEQDEQNITIHKNKKRRIKQILKNHNPFLTRKIQQKISKKKQSNKTALLTQQSEKFFKVIKLSKAKTEGDQYQKKSNDQIAISLVLSQKQKVTLQQKFINVQLNNLQKTPVKQQIKIQNQQNTVFNHFPSQLFLKSQKNKGKSYSFTQKKSFIPTSNRASNFFFPSNKVKLTFEREKIKKQKNEVRPKSSIPHHKHSLDNKYFNFDGTLENHQIPIPERPKTAVTKNKPQRKYSRDIQYSNYETIAKNCIKMKNIKVNEKFQRSMKIQPWGTQNQQKNIDIFDISCSSIRDSMVKQK